MKHLMSYKIFEAEIQPATPPGEDDIKVSQITEDPKLNDQNDKTEDASILDIQSKIKDYNTKKGQIDKAYKLPDDNQVKLAVERILGKDMKKRNEFLVQYAGFVSLERNLAKLQKSNVDDTSSIAKYNKEIQSLNDLLRLEQNALNQAKLNDSIKKTGDAINQFKINISTNNKMIPKLKQSLLGKKTFIDSMKLKLAQISNIKAEK